jgi:hypothetical protein
VKLTAPLYAPLNTRNAGGTYARKAIWASSAALKPGDAQRLPRPDGGSSFHLIFEQLPCNLQLRTLACVDLRDIAANYSGQNESNDQQYEFVVPAKELILFSTLKVARHIILVV